MQTLRGRWNIRPGVPAITQSAVLAGHVGRKVLLQALRPFLARGKDGLQALRLFLAWGKDGLQALRPLPSWGKDGLQALQALLARRNQGLQAPGARLRQMLAQGEDALEQRRKPVTLRADHRVRSITTLVDEINGARLSLLGSLTKKAAEARLHRNWPDRFFQHVARSVKADAVAPREQPAVPA